MQLGFKYIYTIQTITGSVLANLMRDRTLVLHNTCRYKWSVMEVAFSVLRTSFSLKYTQFLNKRRILHADRGHTAPARELMKRRRAT